eukprot:TRINITY_DN41980_c0_g1_i1.p1 TRINITY_DN41980_c0_g1~~TRINITY_DN41980_c0_g1_i1.p1  ORF type:complete len:788 (-),score=158.87 TRINITY_DN41980_c0_g1_i1:61-2073(-)
MAEARALERGSTASRSVYSDAMDSIKLRDGSVRARFLQEEWGPFFAELRCFVQDAKDRQANNFSHHEVMPSHSKLIDLTRRCLDLTERWHGRANVSALYEAYCEAAELDGHSPYVVRDLPQERSADGYTRALDSKARRNLYRPTQQADSTASPESLPVGRMRQESGESPIDNLVLPNLMRRRDALLLFVGHRIQQFFLRVLRRKQLRILEQLGLKHGDSAVTSEGADEVRRLLGEAGESDDESIARRCLAERGQPLMSYGQLPVDARARIDGFLSTEIQRSAATEDDVLEEDLEAFVTHCSSHPGRAFNGSAVQQKLQLLKAMRSPALRVKFRSDLEPFTQHKYFCVPWNRSVPLMAFSEASDQPFVELRPVNAFEVSRFRKNVFAYAESHGLGLSGGGCAEGFNWRPGTLMYEFGTLLCVDESSKVSNHWVTDVEKIVRDCLVLCPDGGTVDMLPGEALHDVGQNPVAASSIGRTQHTQIMRASVSDFPLMGETCKRRLHETMGAWVDIIQVGECEDAFFVSVHSRKPDAVPVLRFFADLRLKYMEAFGRSVDFTVTCHPTDKGEFIVNFAPVACMKKIKVPTGEGCMGLDFDFENPESGERFTKQKLAAAFVDCSHGKGNILAANEEYWRIALEGRPMLTRLYDFNRKPGTRAIAEAFVDAELSLATV